MGGVNESVIDIVCGFDSHLEYVKEVIDQNKGIKWRLVGRCKLTGFLCAVGTLDMFLLVLENPRKKRDEYWIREG